VGAVQRTALDGVTSSDRSATPADPSSHHRPAPTHGPVRALRVVVLGGASMLLAGTAHLAGGGHLPSPGVLAALALFVGLAAAALTRRRCRLPLLLGVLGAEQLGLHLLLGAGAAAGCVGGPMAAGHGASTACPADAVVAADPSGHPLGGPMLTAHLLATLLTAWLLACGEAALWRLVDRVARAAGTDVVGWPDPAARPPALPDLTLHHSSDGWDATAPRGPPAGLPPAR
jgi:hypothetical protein